MSGQTISAPTPDDIDRLARQFLHASALTTLHLGRELVGDDSDLDALQELLARGVLARDATYDLQCLGIVLGMQLAETVDGLDWAMVEDQHGRDPALRYLDTSLLLFPLTMISKRVEDGVAIDIDELYELLCDELEDLKDQVARPS